MKLLMFSKMLQEYPVDQLGDVIAGMGFDGVDLTVRPGGHIAPEEAEAQLPEAVKTLRQSGLEVGMLTTAITRADEPTAEPIFRAAAEQGIRLIKLGYWRYNGFGQLNAQVDQTRRVMQGLAALGRTYEVTPTIHTHSGDYLSATAGVMRLLLDGFNPQEIGAYIDPGHMTVEGSNAGWKQGLDLLSPWIRLVAIKAFGWVREDGQWKIKNMPLRDGPVRWREVLQFLKQMGYDGYLSFHSEYAGRSSWRDLSTPQIIEQTRDDLAYMLPLLKEVGFQRELKVES